MIKHIRIRNFRSLHDVAVDLDPLTVLIGRSGTGKSNFVRAIRLLRNVLGEVDTNNRMQFLDGDRPNIIPVGRDRAGLGYQVVLSVPGFAGEFDYSVQLGAGGTTLDNALDERLIAGGQIVYEKRGGQWVAPPPVDPLPAGHELAMRSLTGVRSVTIARAALTEGLGCYDFPGFVLQYPSAGRWTGTGFTDDGWSFIETAKRIINNLERLNDWAEVVAALGVVNKAVRAVDLNGPLRNQLSAAHQLGDQRLLLDVSQESEGFRRFFAHLLALYQTPPKQTVIFEHPESGIHPAALTALFEEFTDYVHQKHRGQVVLTTHSPQLLDHFTPENIRVVDIENGVTRIGRLDAYQADSIRKHLLFPRELLTAEEPRLEEPEAAGVSA